MFVGSLGIPFNPLVTSCGVFALCFWLWWRKIVKKVPLRTRALRLSSIRYYLFLIGLFCPSLQLPAASSFTHPRLGLHHFTLVLVHRCGNSLYVHTEFLQVIRNLNAGISFESCLARISEFTFYSWGWWSLFSKSAAACAYYSVLCKTSKGFFMFSQFISLVWVVSSYSFLSSIVFLWSLFKKDCLCCVIYVHIAVLVMFPYYRSLRFEILENSFSRIVTCSRACFSWPMLLTQTKERAEFLHTNLIMTWVFCFC